MEPECSSDNDCSRIVGLERCNSGRCETRGILAQNAATGCETSVDATAGTDLKPYCTPQLAVTHALNIGPPLVVLRGAFTSGMVIDGNLEVEGDPSLPPTLTGEGTGLEAGTAIEVIGSFTFSLTGLNITRWSQGLSSAEAATISLSKTQFNNCSTSLDLAEGTHNLSEVSITGGFSATLNGDLHADQLVVNNLQVGVVCNASNGSECDLRNSRIEQSGRLGPGAFIASGPVVTLIGNEFINNLGTAVFLSMNGEAVASFSDNKFFDNAGYGVDCDVNDTFVGENNEFNNNERGPEDSVCTIYRP